jgi:nitrate reductase assembly molybdenum cofactor insertion protein NarJ
MFLAGLEEHYRIYHFSAAPELPDHLGIMLQFLTKDGNEEERDELISLCMIPGLKRMLEGCEDNPTPYKEIFQALLSLLRQGEKIQMEKMVPVTQEEFPSSE